MQKYRKKPVVIEAAEFDGSAESAKKVIDWILATGSRSARYHSNDNTMRIDTLEGTMTANPGDFIIRGVSCEHYPCKPDIFAATYEAA